ncbi:hypothetical protein [Oscillatoria acuminata]|nr:hypothetical protein [Oscillatoria acuminata]
MLETWEGRDREWVFNSSEGIPTQRVGYFSAVPNRVRVQKFTP